MGGRNCFITSGAFGHGLVHMGGLHMQTLQGHTRNAFGYSYILTLNLLRDRIKFKIKFSVPFMSKLEIFWQMFSVAIHLHLIKESIH